MALTLVSINLFKVFIQRNVMVYENLSIRG